MAELGVPEGYQPIGTIAIGYPADDRPEPVGRPRPAPARRGRAPGRLVSVDAVGAGSGRHRSRPAAPPGLRRPGQARRPAGDLRVPGPAPGLLRLDPRPGRLARGRDGCSTSAAVPARTWPGWPSAGPDLDLVGADVSTGMLAAARAAGPGLPPGRARRLRRCRSPTTRSTSSWPTTCCTTWPISIGRSPSCAG